MKSIEHHRQIILIISKFLWNSSHVPKYRTLHVLISKTRTSRPHRCRAKRHSQILSNAYFEYATFYRSSVRINRLFSILYQYSKNVIETDRESNARPRKKRPQSSRSSSQSRLLQGAGDYRRGLRTLRPRPLLVRRLRGRSLFLCFLVF